MIIFVPFTLIAILAILGCLVGESVVDDFARGLANHLTAAQIIVYAIFLFIVVGEAWLYARDKPKKGLFCWVTFWNLVRSAAMAYHTIFVLEAIAEYPTLNILNKILFMIGLLVAFIPYLPYPLFEIIVALDDEVTWLRTLVAGVVSTGGILLGMLLFV